MHIKPDETATLQWLAAATHDMKQALDSDRKFCLYKMIQKQLNRQFNRRLRHLFVGTYVMHLAGSCLNPLHTSASTSDAQQTLADV